MRLDIVRKKVFQVQRRVFSVAVLRTFLLIKNKVLFIEPLKQRLWCFFAVLGHGYPKALIKRQKQKVA
ncbi:hypothetical protein VIBC2010_20020 [Vibrio caribbeanicus ATCC BAA-2122]|uniref:Uncharacterized protein n=1 Tax=Vibrio caribbeanicus ATCC BAA-2122 TaxID=796620 RepID=E3BJ14_9VIBR|nr:hypothetical protein VIBC2010_20020 [Vibrio caribbeanicus ATCC BAA-2122]